MKVEYYKEWSGHLHQDMELKTYGEHGQPALVFPCQGGRFFDYEDFGMVAACQPFIEAGKLQLITVDSIDGQSWANWNAHPAERAHRHMAYDAYITDEVVPFIYERGGANTGGGYSGGVENGKPKILVTGCSMGAYHAANFFFRRPDLFDTLIAISGLFQLGMFVGDYMDDNVYFHTPLAYLPNLEDESILSQYRQNRIIVCVGQGAWEDPMLADAYALGRILEDKGVPAWIDIWGHDVNHDWPWWRKMMPYFLGKVMG
ncbi:MAG TPA: alpha/beta hydrolase-fold protein [Anaerolineales bacterium]|nr:alpha/beta hydrolase-fold protein [Anaerolineales bacterium]